MKRILLVLTGAIAVAMLAVVGASYADNLQNDTTTTAGITTITAGDSTTITYRLVANSSPSGDVGGCDATTSKPVTVTITKPAAVTGPSSLTFTGCGTANSESAAFSAASAGTYSITHSLSGGVSGSLFNNQADFTLTVNAPPPSNTAPSLDLPADQTVEATGANGAAVSYTASASDAEDGTLAPICSPASGSTFPLGITQVNCSVTDSDGATTTGMFNVTVVDTTAPNLTLPANKTAEATGPSGAAVSFSATATDLVDGSVAVDCTPGSGSTFPLGTTAVNCSATDTAGNSATGSFSVTVQDTTPPTLNLPSSITTPATGISGAVVTYSTSASDLVNGSVAVSCSPASGSTFAPGTTTVNCSATDAAGNSASGGFTVTVTFAVNGFYQPVDMTPPSSPTVWNTVKNGSTVPLKFEVFAGSTELTDIAAVNQPLKATGVTCASGVADDIELLASGGTSLRYDTTGGQFIYNWQTPKKVGACYLVTVSMIDGSSLSAYFKLK
jgi:hypothetical protein